MSAFRKYLLLTSVMIALFDAAGATPVCAQRFVDNATKSTVALRQAFDDAARQAAKSTVRIIVSDPGPPHPAAYGTVIASDGFILTKGSEILDYKKIMVKLPGKEVEARIVGNRESYDLAMLKVDAKGLVPAVLADTREPPVPPPEPQRGVRGLGGFGGFGGGRGLRAPTGPIPAVGTPAAPPAGAIPVTVGEFVVTPEAVGSSDDGKDLAPRAYGVISVARRSIPFANGVLGVSLEDAPSGGALVTEVFVQSGAAKAGVAPNDVITAIDGASVNSRVELQTQIRRHHPTDTVTLSILRGGQNLSLRVQLGDTILATREDVEMAVLSGSTNTRSSDFQAVFQHDTVLAPNEMGGPLVDLEGHVIGINIARAGRTETYAIPADLLTERWLKSMEDGTFSPRSRN
jgi:serine protease Do